MPWDVKSTLLMAKPSLRGFQSPGLLELAGDLVSNLAGVSQTQFLRFLEVRLGVFLHRGPRHPRS